MDIYFITSLLHYFITSLLHYFITSLLHCVIASLLHCVIVFVPQDAEARSWSDCLQYLVCAELYAELLSSPALFLSPTSPFNTGYVCALCMCANVYVCGVCVQVFRMS